MTSEGSVPGSRPSGHQLDEVDEIGEVGPAVHTEVAKGMFDRVRAGLEVDDRRYEVVQEVIDKAVANGFWQGSAGFGHPRDVVVASRSGY